MVEFQRTTRQYKGAGIAQCVHLLTTGWTAEGSECESWEMQEFSLLHSAQTGSGAHPASYPMDTGDSFPGSKPPGRDAHHSPPTSVEVKNTWIYTSTPPYVIMAYYLIRYAQGQFYIIRRYIPEDGTLYNYRCGNLKRYVLY
jgi:hypothetical protein